MVFTTTSVWVHGQNDYTDFEDYVDDNGRFVNLGVQVAASLSRHEAVHVNDGRVEIIIPYHAVMSWYTEKAEAPYTKPEDDFCKASEGGGGSYQTVLDGTYTFTNQSGHGRYVGEYNMCCTASSIKVTLDGNTLTLNGGGNVYGNLDTDGARVFFVNTGINVIVPTTGEHTVKVEIPQGSEADCTV